MKLEHGWHLAYCTNIHRGETWLEIFNALNTHTLAVRDRVCPDRPFAIGLRLGDTAARELSEPGALRAFQRWLQERNCYLFTINGFPYGQFHGMRVKEQVYTPDWTTRERLEYTQRLFDLLAELVPEGVAGSVSTVPCSFKEFITRPEQVTAMVENLWRCTDHIAALSERTGKDLHLGLEPEPLCYLETSVEAAAFFGEVQRHRPGDPRWQRHLGINYDACHLAVQYEAAAEALERIRAGAIRLSKVHVSNALRVHPTPEAREALQTFADPVYFHQVIERRQNGALVRYRDLEDALASPVAPEPGAVEWRIHFHVPLHSDPTELFGNTADHVNGVVAWLAQRPGLCQHYEMETYTWEVMPAGLKPRSVVDQLAAEYDWTLKLLARHGVGTS